MSDMLPAGPLLEPPFSDETVRLMVADALTTDRVSVVITWASWCSSAASGNAGAGGNLIVWADDGFTALTGYPLDAALGHTHDFLHGPGTDEESVARMRARMHDDNATTNTVLLYRQDGTAFWDRVVVVPIHDGSGQITHHAVIHTDATADIAREWTRAAEDALVENRADRLGLIDRVVGAMNEHVDYHRAAEALACAAIPQLADWGYLILFDDDGRLDFFVLVADPTKPESARIAEAGIRDCLRDVTWAAPVPGIDTLLDTKPGEPILPVLQDIGLVQRLLTSESTKEALYDLGLGAWLPLPLLARNRRLGLMILEARNPDRFDIPTVVTTTLLRGRVATALGNIRHYQDRRSSDLASPPLPLRSPACDGRLVNDSAGMAVAVRALQTADLPVLVSDTRTGEIVWANDPYCRMVGWPQAELIGHSWRTVHTAQPDEEYAAEKIDRLNRGNTVSMTLLSRRRDGTRFWSRMTVVPVRDGAGEVTHTLAVHADATEAVVTEHVQAAEAELAANRSSRLELIAQAVDALAKEVDYHQAVDALARTAIPELADWGFVALFGDDGRPEYFTDVVADPTKSESARIAGQDVPGWFCQDCTLNATVQKALPDDLILPSPTNVNLLAKTMPPRRVLDALDDLGLGAQLVVPLFARDRTLGVLVLQARDPDRFDTETVVTTALLRSRVSLVLDNIRLHQTERQAALTLQHRLLPPTVTVEGLDTATVYRPSANGAEVGGDWYDVFSLGERGTMLAVGDVVGHDMAAAAVMGQLSILLRARSWTSTAPGPVLSSIVQALDGMRWDDVASVVCLRWLPATDDGSHVEYANLGHPAPLVRLPDGSVHQMPPAQGMPLGLHDPAVEVRQGEFDLPAGSVVVLYTDGLVERRDRPLKDGLPTLAQALRDAPDGTSEQIRDHLLAALVDKPPEDDVCLLVVRGQAPAAPDRQVPPVPGLLLLLDGSGSPGGPATGP